MTERQVATFCRICEPACGLVGTVRDNELVQIRPDKSHPISKGFCCHKGIAALDLHRDPDRLNQPMKRQQDGTFEAVSWDTAVSEIANKLRGILDESGPDAVASYVGNPSAFNSLARPSITSFLRQLGTQRSFGSGTQGLCQQVRRQHRGLRHPQRSSDSRPREHRFPPDPRREPGHLPHEFSVHCGSHGRTPCRPQARREDSLH